MIIYNNILPFKGFKAINICGLIFVRKECKERFTEVDKNHEKIHTRQMLELLIIGFYLWYLIEWLILAIKYKDTKKAYKDIKFEKEAYINENNLNYLNERSWYSFIHY